MRTHHRFSWLWVLVTTTLSLAAADAKAKVLLVTGDDVEPAHNWRACAEATRDILANSGKFDVTVVEKISALDSAADLQKYDIIYLAMYNAKTPPPGDAAKENLVNFVAAGKGFVVSHLASASFKDWPEFRKLCGRYWVMSQSGHGPRSVFKVRVVDKDHPITQGVQDFEQDDELYAKLQGDTPVHVLMEADSDWSKKTEPLAFTLPYGKGRVFHHTFGHDAKALHSPMVEKVIIQGCAWAAKGK
jgi:type 1 glutamine amidotransferase